MHLETINSFLLFSESCSYSTVKLESKFKQWNYIKIKENVNYTLTFQ